MSGVSIVVKLVRCVSPSAFLWLLLRFIVLFLLILSVCMSVCVCVWAMLPDSNKIMMVMINFHNQQFSSQKIMKSKTREWVLSVHRLSALQQCSKTGSLRCNACCTRPMTGHHTMPSLSAALRPNWAWCCSSGVAQTKLKVGPGYVDPIPVHFPSFILRPLGPFLPLTSSP